MNRLVFSLPVTILLKTAKPWPTIYSRPHILHFQKKNSRPVFQYYLLLKTIKLARQMAANSCFLFPSGKLF